MSIPSDIWNAGGRCSTILWKSSKFDNNRWSWEYGNVCGDRSRSDQWNPPSSNCAKEHRRRSWGYHRTEAARLSRIPRSQSLTPAHNGMKQKICCSMTTFVIRLYSTHQYMFENISHKNQQISRFTIKKGSTRLQDILFKSKGIL